MKNDNEFSKDYAEYMSEIKTSDDFEDKVMKLVEKQTDDLTGKKAENQNDELTGKTAEKQNDDLTGKIAEKQSDDLADNSKENQTEDIKRGTQKKNLRQIIFSIAKVACVVFALIGMFSVSVWAFCLDEPLASYIFTNNDGNNANQLTDEGNEDEITNSSVKGKENNDKMNDSKIGTTDDNNADDNFFNVYTNPQMVEMNNNYKLTYEGLTYDEVLRVGYFTLFAERKDGKTIDVEDSIYVTSCVNQFRYNTNKNLKFVYGFSCRAGYKNINIIMSPVNAISQMGSYEDDGFRFRVKFSTGEADNDRKDNDLKVLFLNDEEFLEFIHKTRAIEKPEEVFKYMEELGMAIPEYSAIYKKTVSNDIITVKVGRTDIKAEWNPENNIKSIVIVRENGTETEVLKNGILQMTTGKNPMMFSTHRPYYGNVDVADNVIYIYPYGDMLREDEDVTIIVDGEILEEVTE